MFWFSLSLKLLESLLSFSVSETLIAVALRTGEISNQSYGKIHEANKNLIWIVVSIKGGGEGRGKNGCPLILATLTCTEIVFQQEKVDGYDFALYKWYFQKSG